MRAKKMVIKAIKKPEETGAELSVRFANTVAWRLSDLPDDRITSFDLLLRFALRAGVLDERQEGELRAAAASHPDEAGAAFESAIRLREAVYNLLYATAKGHTRSAEDIEVLNLSLARAHAHLALFDEGEPAWGWVAHDDAEALHVLEWEAARSAAEMLTSGRLARLKACPGEGCGWLFVDTSRNGTRRWCEMDLCGNRNKVRRHRALARQAAGSTTAR